jgi:rhodanese-related sulfurtransferase
MATELTVQDLRGLLETDSDHIALIDVRETAEYNLAHIAGSVSLPRRLIEVRLVSLVPWRGTRTVVCDDDGRRARLAATTMQSMGYTDISVLSGGLNRWVTEGLSTEWGFNVPSKDFGEQVLLQDPVPEVEPDELAGWVVAGRRLVILDSRTPEEHQRSCIPGSRSMPGAELGLRAWELATDPDTTVVVHCAGRTRSIIGAATLQRLGVANVFALKNGTMGWLLSGRELETGSDRLDLPRPLPETQQRAEGRARGLGTEKGVRFAGIEEARALLQRGETENVYAVDVRTEAEYRQGHIPGFRWVPGGQAVQASDSHIAVRGGTILFACDGLVRAAMTASWFRQMGYPRVHVLAGGTSAWRDAGLSLEAGMPAEEVFSLDEAKRRVPALAPRDLERRLIGASVPRVLFVGPSDEFSRAHIPGSTWLSRSWLELRIAEAVPSRADPIVVTCADGQSSLLAAATLHALGYKDVSVLLGGLHAWSSAGQPVETGLHGVSRPPDDVLPASRSYAEMLNYLRWEEALGEKYAAPPGWSTSTRA